MSPPIDIRLPYRKTENGDRSVEEHESFGFVTLSRVYGGADRFFGSHLENQSTSIGLRIHRAQVEHSLSQDRVFGSQRPLMEIYFTPAQFAELLTSMGVGQGTPCTLTSILGISLDPPPKRSVESKRIRDSFDGKVRGVLSTFKDKAKQVSSLLEKKNLTLSDKKQIEETMAYAIREIEANIPYMLSSFQESTQKVITQAKIEVDAFVALGLHKMGLDAFEKKMLEGKPPMILLSEDNDGERT